MNERRVERVARAICWKMGHDPDVKHPGNIFPDDKPLWGFYVIHAQAAVKALEGCLTPEYESSCVPKREDSFVELD